MKKLILTIFITLFSILVSFGQNIPELKQKAEQGDADAQNTLGLYYENGKGVAKDLREAVNGIANLLSKVTLGRKTILACVMRMVKVWEET